MSRDNKSDSLDVDAGSMLAGTLGRADSPLGGSYFGYRSESEDDAVSLTMPVRKQPYLWKAGVHPVFDMHLPEGELREALTRRFSKAIQGFDDFDLLSIVGPHQLGRVRVHSGAGKDAPPALSLSELKRYRGTEELYRELLERYAQFSGVSGAQPKILVRDQDEFPPRLTHQGATHIVKFWNAWEYPQLAANEYFCLRAAEMSGLPVPEYTLSDDGRMLIVKRFDCTPDGQYLGFEDFCSLNGYVARQKYVGTYEACAKRIRLFVSPANTPAALQQFFMSVALSCALRNGDAHLKNFGVLYRHGGRDEPVWLAPTFDVVSTTPYLKNDTLALLLGGSKRWPGHRQITVFGINTCGLTQRKVAESLDQIAKGIQLASKELQDYRSTHPAFDEVGGAMLAAWSDGVKHSLHPAASRSPGR